MFCALVTHLLSLFVNRNNTFSLLLCKPTVWLLWVFLASQLIFSVCCLFCVQAILAFCWVYIRKYQSRQESEVISTITAICALSIALITSALLPLDIFLVSFMKYSNGTYKVCLISPRACYISWWGVYDEGLSQDGQLSLGVRCAVCDLCATLTY